MVRTFHAARRILVCVLLAAGMAAAIASLRAQEPAGPDVILLEAKRVFEALDYERAVTALDRVVSLLEARSPLDAAQRQLLTEAYELRGRARFGLNDRDGARNDFRRLLTVDPAHVLAGQVSPNVVAIFTELKKALVGTLNLMVAPADAVVQIDGVLIDKPGTSIPIVAGQHTVAARQAGYRPVSQPVAVTAGASADLSIVLERISATVNVMTVPSEVEVLIDGVSRGQTTAGPPPPEYADVIASLGVPAAAVSKPFVLVDVAPGTHVIELRRDCYVRSEQRVDVQKPADYRLPPAKLVKAVGAITVDSAQPGSVFIDGQSRGVAPLTADDICEGARTVEVRSAFARFVKRVDLRTGDKLVVHADPRAAIGVLSTTGLPEGLRGGPDLRLAIERMFQSARSLTVFAPPADQVEQALAKEKLAPGWLSFDTARRPIGEAAANITASARQEIGVRLTKTLDVQAVAAVTVASRDDRSDIFFTILAAGSGEPDTIRIKLDDPDSVNRALTRLEATPTLFRTSAGLQVADVLDIAGAVVVGVEPGGLAAMASIAPGDVIVRASGQPVADAARFAGLLGTMKAGEALSLELRDRTGAAKRAELRPVAVPEAVAMVDQTLLFNKLLLDFRGKLVSPVDALEESVARLNLAVALMRLGSFADAKVELDKVKLPDGPGVSNGTVQYLIGLCREALGQFTEAETAWRSAAASTAAQLTTDGPAIKDLAERKLAELARRGRRPSGQ